MGKKTKRTQLVSIMRFAIKEINPINGIYTLIILSSFVNESINIHLLGFIIMLDFMLNTIRFYIKSDE
jgi:hypothetical protein